MSSLNSENAKLVRAIREYGEEHIKPALLERAFGEKALPPSLYRELILNIDLSYGIALYEGGREIRVLYSVRSEIPFLTKGLEQFTATIEVPTFFFEQQIPKEDT